MPFLRLGGIQQLAGIFGAHLPRRALARCRSRRSPLLRRGRRCATSGILRPRLGQLHLGRRLSSRLILRWRLSLALTLALRWWLAL